MHSVVVALACVERCKDMWLPLMPLNSVLFPGMPMPLAIFEDRYKRMVGECMGSEEPFGVVLIRSGPEVGGIAEPHEVGACARIIQAEKREDAMDVVVIGQERFRICELAVDGDLLRAEVEVLDAEPERVSGELCGEMAQMLSDHVATILTLLDVPNEGITIPREPERLSFMIAAHLTGSLGDRQGLLELNSAAERLLRGRELLRAETEQYRLLLAARRRAHETQPGDDRGGMFVSRN